MQLDPYYVGDIARIISDTVYDLINYQVIGVDGLGHRACEIDHQRKVIEVTPPECPAGRPARRGAMSFVHLHTHSEFSLLDGANQIPALVRHVKKLGMDSLAIPDHGNFHGAWAFYETAKAEKIRPILGFEAYMAFCPRQAQEKPKWAPAAYSHLVLLATSRTGYKNLARLSSIGYTEGFYRRPRIDREALERHSEGLICLAACLSGEVALWLRQGKYEEARETARWVEKTFGPDRFWLEIQEHGIPEEALVARGMLELGRELSGVMINSKLCEWEHIHVFARQWQPTTSEP